MALVAPEELALLIPMVADALPAPLDTLLAIGPIIPRALAPVDVPATLPTIPLYIPIVSLLV
jgi:hypothetical protein